MAHPDRPPSRASGPLPHAERAVLVTDLQQAMAEERKILLAQADWMSLGVVDHAFYRAAQLVAAVLVALRRGLLFTLFFVKRMVRPAASRS